MFCHVHANDFVINAPMIWGSGAQGEQEGWAWFGRGKEEGPHQEKQHEQKMRVQTRLCRFNQSRGEEFGGTKHENEIWTAAEASRCSRERPTSLEWKKRREEQRFPPVCPLRPLCSSLRCHAVKTCRKEVAFLPRWGHKFRLPEQHHTEGRSPEREAHSTEPPKPVHRFLSSYCILRLSRKRQLRAGAARVRQAVQSIERRGHCPSGWHLPQAPLLSRPTPALARRLEDLMAFLSHPVLRPGLNIKH